MDINIRYLVVILLSLLFPIGLWLAFEGYELFSMVFMLLGWVPIAKWLADADHYTV